MKFQIGTFRGTLTLVVGDNLGSQYIGGYKQLSSALRKCRFCMTVSDDMQQKVRTHIGKMILMYVLTYKIHSSMQMIFNFVLIRPTSSIVNN